VTYYYVATAVDGSSNESAYSNEARAVVPSQPFLTGFSCSPASLVSPGTSTCVVTLNGPAPDGGVIVLLNSNNTSLLTVPGFVVVAPGASSATFVATAGAVSGTAAVQLTASFGGVSQSILVTLSGQRPLIFLTSVVNAASLLPGPVAPGELVTIFGSGMGPTTGVGVLLNSAGLIDNSLAGARVLFDGIPAPLTFVRSDQINAVTPYEVLGRTFTQLQVEYGALRSAPAALPVADTAPGIFTLDSSGRGNGAILNQDGSVNSTSNPASRGSVVALFATGEGQTFPAGVNGKPAADPFPRPIRQVRVLIGGIDAQILYAGGAPGLVAGVLQVNARIPDGVAPGNAVPVSLVIGELNSQSGVTLAVNF